MKYLLELEGKEVDAFVDIFVAGLKPGSKTPPIHARVINKVTAMGLKYENDRFAGVK